jgi:hypothetical protein
MMKALVQVHARAQSVIVQIQSYQKPYRQAFMDIFATLIQYNDPVG